MFAFFCLPRQFHIGVVECAEVADVKRARWWFGGYLLLLSIVVIPIVAASLPLDAAGRSTPRAMPLVLWVPLANGQAWLALLAYLGGYAAATGMVIVASVALATMISNDPGASDAVAAAHGFGGAICAVTVDDPVDARVANRLRVVRRLRLLPPAPNAPSLASIGTLALAAVAQFAPRIIARCTGRARAAPASRRARRGFVIWSYTLLIPAVVGGRLARRLAHEALRHRLAEPQHCSASHFRAFRTASFWSLAATSRAGGAVAAYRPAIGERLRVAGARMLDGCPERRGGSCCRAAPPSATCCCWRKDC
jgi:Na+/proline symporter